ncbi:MAG: hypothetical protein ACOC6J_05205 [Spirochaetota bacterium]
MSRRALAASFAAVLLLSGPALVFGQNPLRGGASGGEQAQLYDGPVPRFIVEWSRTLQQSIASLSRRVLDGEWVAAVTAFLLSIVFGVVHIAGPGHGKVFAVSYFAGRDARPRDGLAYSAVVNAVDSLSALLVVMVGYVALRAVLPDAREQAPRILQLVSYALIVVFGVAHLITEIPMGTTTPSNRPSPVRRPGMTVPPPSAVPGADPPGCSRCRSGSSPVR